MPNLTTLAYTASPGSAPASQSVPAGQEWVLQSVRARYNGASASGSFLPVLSVYSQDGVRIGRFRPETTLIVGDTAEVTFGPF